MDAGLAAVLGALAGSVATIAAAWAGSWSQREAAKIASRTEHHRQALDHRRQVYRPFAMSATKLQNLLRAQRIAAVRGSIDAMTVSADVVNEALVQQVAEAVESLDEPASECYLAGPEEVVSSVISVHEAAYGTLESLRRMLHEAEVHDEPLDDADEAVQELRASVQRFWKELAKFRGWATVALADDGLSGSLESQTEERHAAEWRDLERRRRRELRGGWRRRYLIRRIRRGMPEDDDLGM
ncbi:hypothetical protein [Streptomyces sp. NPDC058614]|uniref:hypothetical protein n=1 Tax=Streptomyces sp. NPDC058614 TaxID=3346557 RepID=UPI0036666765